MPRASRKAGKPDTCLAFALSEAKPVCSEQTRIIQHFPLMMISRNPEWKVEHE